MTLLSMTGFGQTHFTFQGNNYRAELKSLNHRFIEIKLRVGREFQPFDFQIRQTLQKMFARGSIDLRIERVVQENTPTASVQINFELAKTIIDEVKKLKTLGLTTDITVSDLLKMPDVLTVQSESPTETDYSKLQPHIEAIAKTLHQARAAEGSRQKLFFIESLKTLQSTLLKVKATRTQSTDRQRETLQTKIKALFEAYPNPWVSTPGQLENRVAIELALLADRSDFAEETERFFGHLEHFKKLIDEGGPLGRKLEFVLQELGREINTLGSKAQDFEIAKEVIETKTLLEQMREQVLNLE